MVEKLWTLLSLNRKSVLLMFSNEKKVKKNIQSVYEIIKF